MGRLLVGYDGSPAAQRAVDRAAELARADAHDIVLLTVVPRQVSGTSLGKLIPAGVELPDALNRTFEANARHRLEDVAKPLQAKGLTIRIEVRVGDTPTEFVQLAEELGASAIVIGQNSFATHLDIGPNAEAILKRSKVPVTVVD